MPGESTFSAQITNLVGGATIDEEFCDDSATQGAKEIIMQLPTSLFEKCSDKSTLNASPTTLDLDTATIGKILYCTRNNGSYDIPCRSVSSPNAGLLDDSTATNYYATADDPAYFVRDNVLEIKPIPDNTYTGAVYHIVYPSIDVSAGNTIANFPNEAEYLVVLYAAMQQLLKFQATMSASFNSDITTALTAVNTALDRINTHVWDDEETFLTANSQLTRVKDALDNAQKALDDGANSGPIGNASYDTATLIVAEDTELVASVLSIATAELNRASIHLNEWGAISTATAQEAQGFIGEVTSRLQADTSKYQWYGDQYAKLATSFASGIAALKGV